MDSNIFSVSLACHSNLMPHMQTSQTVFDELISCTPVVLEPFQSRSLCSNVNNPGSIDDFLAEYRHESSSILSFLSSLEETNTASRVDKQQKSGSGAKKALSKTDSESQEERRRRKNCEYQRRFREKKMRLELQRLYRVAFPPFAELP